MKEQSIDFGFDELKMYFNEDYKINDMITIHIPTIGEIINFGEKDMYESISMFTGNTTTFRVQLWDMGIDWNKISDFELFTLLVKNSKKEKTKLIFGDIDFSTLKITNINNNGIEYYVLKNDDGLMIDELIYLHIREYIRKLFGIYPKVEKAKGRITKESIIEEEKQNMLIESQNKNNYSGSFLLSLISSMINHPGFKYDIFELKDVGIFAFMDSVKRLQVYENSVAFMKGMYSGMMDTSKMPKSEKEKALNWLRNIYDE